MFFIKRSGDPPSYESMSYGGRKKERYCAPNDSTIIRRGAASDDEIVRGVREMCEYSKRETERCNTFYWVGEICTIPWAAERAIGEKNVRFGLVRRSRLARETLSSSLSLRPHSYTDFAHPVK